jgi:hypothetical protein
MTKIKGRWIVIIAIVIFLAAFCVYADRKIRRVSQNDVPSAYVLSNEYLDIIDPKHQSNIRIDEIIQNKVTNPLAMLAYDKDYDLILYKLDSLDHTFSIADNLLMSDGTNLGKSALEVYRIISKSNFTLRKRYGNNQFVEKIFCEHDGEISNIFQNDSIYSCQLFCKAFSVRYSIDGNVDIAFKANRESPLSASKVYVDLLALQRNRSVYLLIMSPKDNVSFDPHYLMDIIGYNSK